MKTWNKTPLELIAQRKSGLGWSVPSIAFVVSLLFFAAEADSHRDPPSNPVI